LSGYHFGVRVVLLAALLVGLTAPARADVYMWTDSDGVIHFTNMKPDRVNKWKKLSMDGTAPSGTKAAAQRGGCPRCDKVTSNDTSPERFHRYDDYIAEASQLYRIPVPLIRAVIKVESDYDPHVVSSADCKGLMQVHPQVEIDMGVVGDVFDPRTNIMTGTRLLRWLANHVDGDLVLTIAGYHAGLGSLAKYGYTVPPYAYTRQYLKMVLERYYQYKTDEQRRRAK
jgi:soluble lytic murein transglycosylase-like protein